MQMCMVDTIVTCLLMHMALGAHLFLHNDKLHTLCPSQASPAARATSNGSQRAFEHVRVSCGCGARVKSHDPMMQSHGMGPKGRVWVRTFKCYLLQKSVALGVELTQLNIIFKAMESIHGSPAFVVIREWSPSLWQRRHARIFLSSHNQVLLSSLYGSDIVLEGVTSETILGVFAHCSFHCNPRKRGFQLNSQTQP